MTKDHLKETLAIIEQGVARLRDLLAQEMRKDRYDEGFTEGYERASSKVRELFNIAATPDGRKNSPSPVAPPSQPREQPQPKRLSAPTKDALVRQFLADHPGARYRDIAKALSVYTATRVYKLVERGEVRKTEEGRFFLIEPN